MRFESVKTPHGNVGVSYVSQELADAQAKDMEDNNNWNCTNCSSCSDCSRCSGCSRCSHIAKLWDKEGLAAEPSDTPGQLGAPSVPVIPNIHQIVFDAVSKPQALDMKTWHTCETTHCRAGWVVHLAGEAGKALEKFHDTPLAALLIYHASSSLLVSPTRFYEDNKTAMADMKRLAELEAEAG